MVTISSAFGPMQMPTPFKHGTAPTDTTDGNFSHWTYMRFYKVQCEKMLSVLSVNSINLGVKG
jgi:hypothetical protein